MARRPSGAERLLAAAKRAAEELEKREGPSRLVELHHAVIACFEAEDAVTLDQALTLARAQDPDAAALIEGELEYVSTHQYIEDGTACWSVCLFAVPVFLEAAPPFAWDNVHLKRNNAFAELERSFRKKGLAGHSATIALQPYLYYPHELENLSYFDIAAMTVNMQANLLEGMAVSAAQLGQTGEGHPVALSDAHAQIELRYLLGVIRDHQGSLPFAPKNNGGRARLLFERRLAEWRQFMLQRLPDCLDVDFNGPVKLDVLRPQLFYEAYHQGLKALLNSNLYYGIMHDLQQAGTLPGATHALIVSDRSKEQARNYIVFVYAQEKDELLLARGRSVLPFESAKEARVDLALVLQAVGIEDVAVLAAASDGRHTEAVEAGESGETSHFITLPGNHTVH